MNHKEIKRRFIEFFTSRAHLEIPNSSLVPDYDPTLLLTNSGMAPLKPYFLGQAEPPSRRLVNVQRCVRTTDIQSVGDIHHLTFFEMLGNWSIGDPKAADGVGSASYFKKEAIQFAWDLLEEFGLDRQRVWVGVFGGDPNWSVVPPDDESAKAWSQVGVPDNRILKLPTKDSFWFSEPTGPCGPNTDVLYDLGREFSCGKATCGPSCDCGRFLEIWNAGVFMMYNRQADGSFQNLPAKSVDAGAGLERFALVLQKVHNLYETDVFKDLVAQIVSLAEVGRQHPDQRSVRVIADHLRAATFLAADGVIPSNTERGYVLRRLLRRAVLHGLLLDISGYFVGLLAEKVIEQFGDVYSHLESRRTETLQVLEDEEKVFGLTLKRGLREFGKIAQNEASVSQGVFSGEAAFHLYDSYGLPLELTEELAGQKGWQVDVAQFEKSLGEQKSRSKQSRHREGYDPSKIRAAHTAAHLLNAALRQVLGTDLHQMGQKISEDKFTHDFNFPRKLTGDEVRRVEELVRQKIAEDLPVTMEETTYAKALAEGAEALFEEKYKSVGQVTLYRIGDFSRELCGGPHLSSTGQIKEFKITKEEAVSQGARRIKALVE